jgi:tight adherence protein B
LTFKAQRRRRRLHEQLPDALNLIIRSLKAGHPVSVTVGTVAQEMSDPIGSEFGLAVDEMTYGLPLHEAFDNMARRVRVDDLNFVAVAIQIQHQVGGNLAGVLSNIEAVVRERFHMLAKVRAISAEGRMSGWVIGAMPRTCGP